MQTLQDGLFIFSNEFENCYNFFNMVNMIWKKFLINFFAVKENCLQWKNRKKLLNWLKWKKEKITN